ncbi:MAG: hypothetical protein IPH48_22400 [bacterium]|nr:hypothetical protein [bacterium]
MTGLRHIGRATPCLLAMLVLLGAAGCGDEPTSAPPPTESCVVEGVLSHAVPQLFDNQVQFTRAAGPDYYVTATVDNAGHYRMELPSGDYIVAALSNYRTYYLAPGGVLTQSWSEADTLRLDSRNSPRRIDFPFGSLRVTMDGLAAMEGWEAQTTLSLDDDGASMDIGGMTARIADGRLVMDHGPVVPGNYRVELRLRRDWSHSGERFWLPSTRTYEAEGAVLHRIAPDSLTTIIMSPASPSRLAGRIRGSWLDLGLSTPDLMAFDADSNVVAGPWDVDVDGRFELVLADPKPVRLSAGYNGQRQWFGGATFAEAAVFDLQPDGDIQGLDMNVSGVLVRPVLTLPVDYHTGGVVVLYDPDTLTPVQSLGISVSQQSGQAFLAPGTYLAYLRNDFGLSRWRSQWYDRAPTAGSATLVTIPADGGTLVLDLVIEEGGIIAGTTTLAGSGEHWGHVVVTSAEEDVLLCADYVSTTSPDFTLPGVADGGYKLGLVSNGMFWLNPGDPVPAGVVWYPGTTDWSAAGVIAVAGADSVGGIHLAIQ